MLTKKEYVVLLFCIFIDIAAGKCYNGYTPLERSL